MVACGLNERITNQQVFIITGPQGCGKTTWIENLMPTKMRDYLYSGKINPSSKDSTLLLAERLLVNMDELASLNHKNIEDFKELITKTKISERRVYGKYTNDYSRIASFAASSNHTDILTDSSGNRRFLVNETEVDIDCTVYENLDQFYAQAIHLYKSGFKYFFDTEDIVKIEKQNNNFRKFSPLENLLNDHIIKVEQSDKKIKPMVMSSTEIIEQLKDRVENCPLIHPNQLGKAMSSLKHKTTKVNGGIKKYVFCFRK
ncbi:VapE domain-containing protein [Nonlabens sp. Asnod3-A02]|uniref:VapE domain-containing protein n=1 Tax=Nonlabens sp. Asnod3-A02 TaxID=3160579 RepID=UPI003865D2DA